MRIRILMMAVALLCGAGAFAPAGVHAQAGTDSMVVESTDAGVEAAAVEGEAVVPAPTSSGLPQRAAPPRTMSDQWPVFVAFAVTWIGIVGYFVRGIGRSAALAERLIAREEKR